MKYLAVIFLVFSVIFAEAALRRGCPSVCPQYYQPLCALSRWRGLRTFSNPCFLAVHNCKHPRDRYSYIHDGECRYPGNDFLQQLEDEES
ncbi:vasotab [Bacillus rossius redtenbacheri]|uniref:vasotab n=1 Tax=Bacillus rossius redtenbacheri TaxID=93214 RepID=UPI002FDCFE99